MSDKNFGRVVRKADIVFRAKNVILTEANGIFYGSCNLVGLVFNVIVGKTSD